MKNKKGFTLIELIAVIVIIGIISSIAIVGVSRYIESARESTYNSYVETMKKAAENMMIECASGKGNCYGEIPNKGEINRIDYDDELVKNGYAEKLKDPENDGEYCNGYVEVENISDDNNDISKLSYSACLKCNDEEKSDKSECNEKEETTYALTSCDNLNLSADSIIAENDWTNGDRIIKFGCDENKQNCKYQKTFSIDDGNKKEKGEIRLANGTTCKDIIINIDKIKPKCTIEPTEAVSMSDNGWYRDNVTMEINYNYADNEGKTITNWGLSTSSVKSYNNQSTLEVSNGITTVFGYVKDSLGNEGICDPVEVKVDSNKPAQTLALGYQIYNEEDKSNSVAGSNSLTMNNLHKYGYVRGVVIYLKESITSSISIKYNYKEKVGNEEVSRTITKTGISGKEITNILSSSPENNEIKIMESIKIENVNPQKIEKVYLIINSTDSDIYTNKNMLVYSFPSNGTSGVNFDDGAFSNKLYTEVTTNKTVKVGVKSNSDPNNPTYKYIEINKIDKLAPIMTGPNFYKWQDNNTKPSVSNVSSLSTYTTGEWSDKNVIAKVSGIRDEGVSGIYDYYFLKTKENNTEKFNQSYINIEADGETKIKFEVCDRAGNCTTTQEYTVLIDTGDIDVKVTAYKLNDDNSKGDKISDVQNGNLIVPSDTSKWVNHRLSFTLSASSGIPIANIKYRLSPGGSTVDTYDKARDSLVDIEYTTKTYNSNSVSWNFDFLSDGARKIEIVLTTASGKNKTINVYGKIDRTKPSCDGVNKTTTYSSSGVSGNVKCKDTLSGCEKATYTFSGLKSSGNVTIKDKAGNTNSCSVSVNSTTCGNNDCNDYGYRESCFNDTTHNTLDKCRRLEGDSAIFNPSNKTCCMQVRYCISYNSTYTCYY